MAKKLLPEFISLLPLYQQWAVALELSPKDRRSVESAVRILESVEARSGANQAP